MKYLYLLILSSLLFFTASAVSRTYRSGNFLLPTSWSPVGLNNGDVLIVESGIQLTIVGQVDLVKENLGNMTIIIKGILDLNNGKLSLGAASSVYLSNNAKIITEKGAADKINIGASEKYDGKSGTIVGPAIADISTPASSSSIAGSGFQLPSATIITKYESLAIEPLNTALPVNFLSFNLTQATTGISIKWATAQEENANVFQIERSEDSRTWRTVGTVKAVGNSSTIQNYSFTDKTNLNKIAYYRIKEVDSDGKSTYTEVKNVSNQSNLTNTVNNATIIASGSNVVINFSKQVAGTVVVRLISYSGQVLAQQTYNQVLQQVVFNKTYVNKGNYIVSVSNNSDLNVSKQVAL